MRKLRLFGLALVVAGMFGAFPALAHGPSYGKWTYAGSGKSWHGTFSSGKPIWGVAIYTKAAAENPVVSFVLGGKKAHLYPYPHGGAQVIVGHRTGRPVTVKNLKWTLRVKKPLASSKLINGCISTGLYGSSGLQCRFSLYH